MNTDVTVPALGESIKTGVIASWLKADGEAVKEGDEIFELETEKSMLSFPSPADGVLSIAVEAGQTVTIGQKVATILAGASGAQRAAAKPTAVAPASAAVPLSPATRRIVAETGLDPAEIRGTGRAGRITVEDAVRAVSAKAPASQPPVPVTQAAPPPPAPSTKGAVDLAPDGRPRRRVPMTTIRKRTAERLVQAKQNTAYLTTFNEIDMQKVSTIRTLYREGFEKDHGIRIGFMSFFVKAACQALKQYPEINSAVDGEDILYQQFYDIGIAISIDTGLIVPVLRNAERMSFADIESAISSFAKRAGQKKLLPDELAGGTFTITNGGVFGSLLSTPIPAYPQTAILGMHAIKKRPVVIEDQIVIRPMMYVALTYDHRVIDGREAIGFLARIKELIEEPDKLLLQM